MAALTLQLGTIAVNATAGTAGNGRLVNVPKGARTVTLLSRALASRVVVQGNGDATGIADDGAIGTPYRTLATGVAVTLRVPLWAQVAGWTIWVAPDTSAATTVEYHAEE
jgi:hypothetical protein